MEESLQFAKKYLEDILSFYGLNTYVTATTDDGEVIELSVPSTHSNGFLIGTRGDNIRALQYLLSTALRNNGYEKYRVSVDIAGYKKEQYSKIEDRAKDWIEEVKNSGEPKHIPPMNAAERRVVHKMAEEYGVMTESEGMGHERHIVIKPKSEAATVKEESETSEPEAKDIDSSEE